MIKPVPSHCDMSRYRYYEWLASSGIISSIGLEFFATLG
jgi:hypothetical protein